jgi:hypothetical protein
MVGLPTVATYWFAFQTTSHGARWGGERTHPVLIVLLAYHLTFGPDFVNKMWNRIKKTLESKKVKLN